MSKNILLIISLGALGLFSCGKASGSVPSESESSITSSQSSVTSSSESSTVTSSESKSSSQALIGSQVSKEEWESALEATSTNCHWYYSYDEVRYDFYRDGDVGKYVKARQGSTTISFVDMKNKVDYNYNEATKTYSKQEESENYFKLLGYSSLKEDYKNWKYDASNGAYSQDDNHLYFQNGKLAAFNVSEIYTEYFDSYGSVSLSLPSIQ